MTSSRPTDVIAPRPHDVEAVLEALARDPLATGGEHLARLVEALRPRRREPVAVAEVRLRGLLVVLERRPALTIALAAHLQAVLLSRMHRTLYAESGVLASQGFLTGLWSRVIGRVLPPAVDPDFLRDLVAEVFDSARDAVWVAAMPRELWHALFDRLALDEADFDAVRRHCRSELLEAMRMTSHRLAALGMEPALLRYLPSLARRESPFLAQSDEVRQWLGAHAHDASLAHDGHLEVLLSQCSEIVANVRRRSRETGVGVDLVFVLARAEQLIARLRILRLLAVPDQRESAAARRERSVDFFVQLVGWESGRNRIAALFEGTTQLLARRVTEQASRSGEHYMTETAAEYRAMFRAAAGAGLIVGLMALLKILASQLGLAAVWEAVAYSLVYGIGFVVVHVLHLTIATKQPAMTAATLAAALDGPAGREDRLERIVTIAASVSRTQWVSIAGNVTIGFLTALCIAMVGATFLGVQPVDTAKAGHLMHDIHPWHSLALFHAAIAGVYLFLSGLISGYYDNQALYHRVPERLRRARWLRQLLGAERLGRLAAYVERNLGALVGNFLFGCMLGSTGIIGVLFGLPIGIQHVAFASANLAYGLQALDFAVGWPTIVISASGVIAIGLINLVVSFTLALDVALRSRGLTRAETRGLIPRIADRLRRAPLEFLVPPSPRAP